jgi:NADPH-dependent 2,4-dienoyl-CoA reductase/sulfur reductase-like enzyme
MSSGITRQNTFNSIDSADIVIVGNGIAGQTAAIEARRLAPDKRIVMITEQSHPTINTPALKQFVIGKVAREQLLAYPAGTERVQRIHVINARVEEIRAGGKYVCLTGGRGFGYESLLIATGSTAKGLPANLPGRNFEGVLTLHRLNDYLDMRRRLSEVDEAVVIGGGLHAIETVMSLLYWGIRVHWLIRSDTFLPRMLDRPASDMVLERIQRAGAKFYTGTEALGIVGRVGVVAGVITSQHQLLPCQLVLVCTGTTPVTTLAKYCDLPMKHQHGILVENQLRTSVPDIYAAGDVAALQDPQTGEYAPRAQWYAAVLQGRIAASAMTGSAQPEEGFGVPWHATRVGELSMLTVGNPLQWRDAATTLTDSSRGSYRSLSIVDDRLVGYLSLSPTQPDGLAIKRLIDEGLSIRDIKKALLKGEFDARKYFSRQRTYAAQCMLNTGKLPSPALFETPRRGRPPVRSLRETGPVAVPGTGSDNNGVKNDVDTAPLFDTPSHLNYFVTNMGTRVSEKSPASRASHRDAIAWDRFSTIPDNYIYQPRRSDGLQRGEDIPGESEALFFESGIDPNQEMHRPVDPPRVIESTLVALPSNGSRRASRSLWSYSDRLPVIKTKRRGKQFVSPPVTGATERESPGKVYPSSSLWFYTDRHAAVKKGW